MGAATASPVVFMKACHSWGKRLLDVMHKSNLKSEIEIFDLSHIHTDSEFFQAKKAEVAALYSIILDAKSAMTADSSPFGFYTEVLKWLTSHLIGAV